MANLSFHSIISKIVNRQIIILFKNEYNLQTNINFSTLAMTLSD